MRVDFARNFLKKLDKSPEKIRERFEERLSLFEINPFASELNNHSLKGELAGRRSINITGDWRAIFKEFDDGIIFLDIGTHSQLYD